MYPDATRAITTALAATLRRMMKATTRAKKPACRKPYDMFAACNCCWIVMGRMTDDAEVCCDDEGGGADIAAGSCHI
eukprot:scaffold24159_cov19-Prasinocladus_malaysianus.AAC.1